MSHPWAARSTPTAVSQRRSQQLAYESRVAQQELEVRSLAADESRYRALATASEAGAVRRAASSRRRADFDRGALRYKPPSRLHARTAGSSNNNGGRVRVRGKVSPAKGGKEAASERGGIGGKGGKGATGTKRGAGKRATGAKGGKGTGSFTTETKGGKGTGLLVARTKGVAGVRPDSSGRARVRSPRTSQPPPQPPPRPRTSQARERTPIHQICLMPDSPVTRPGTTGGLRFGSRSAGEGGAAYEVVHAAGVNVRTRPDVNLGLVLRQLPAGTRLWGASVSASVARTGANDYWVRTSFEGRTAYVLTVDDNGAVLLRAIPGGSRGGGSVHRARGEPSLSFGGRKQAQPLARAATAPRSSTHSTSNTSNTGRRRRGKGRSSPSLSPRLSPRLSGGRTERDGRVEDGNGRQSCDSQGDDALEDDYSYDQEGRGTANVSRVSMRARPQTTTPPPRAISPRGLAQQGRLARLRWLDDE